MKLKEIEVAGFRGCPDPTTLVLNENSVCIRAENGMGKSSFVDALEFWSTGDVLRFHRQGRGIDALVNVDRDEAKVTCKRKGSKTLYRTLRGKSPSNLTAIGPAPVDDEIDAPIDAIVAPIPVLRHSEMAGFMDMTAGEKRNALLRLLQLESLIEFRSALVAACNSLTKDASTDEAALADIKTELQGAIEQKDLFEAILEKTRSAGLSPPQTLAEFETLSVPRTQPPEIERIDEDLHRAWQLMDASTIRDWNEVLARPGMSREALLENALSATSQLIETWDDESCPVCLTPQDRVKLSDEITVRRSALASSRDALRNAKSNLQRTVEGMRLLHSAVSSAEGGTSESESAFTQTKLWVGELLHQVELSLRESSPIAWKDSPASMEELRAILPTLQNAQQKALGEARDELLRLQDMTKRQTAAQDRCRNSAAASERAKRALVVAEALVGTEIKSRFALLSEHINRYYSFVTALPTYSDIQIVYRDEGRSGAEFVVLFDGRRSISPPQRIMSESQIAALGLSVFLAQVRRQEGAWRTIVLDDVVNTFDGFNRVGVAQLLEAEFSEWQVIFVTHDHSFAKYIEQRQTRGWKHITIASWTPAAGPTLRPDNPVEELRRAVFDEGRSADGLGSLARIALEEYFDRILGHFAFPISYKKRADYTAGDFLDALIKGFENQDNEFAAMQILREMRMHAMTSTLLSHHRPDTPTPSREELAGVVASLQELDKSLECTICNAKAWAAKRADGTAQCECGALEVGCR